jgi:hypothetical protein
MNCQRGFQMPCGDPDDTAAATIKYFGYAFWRKHFVMLAKLENGFW